MIKSGVPESHADGDFEVDQRRLLRFTVLKGSVEKNEKLSDGLSLCQSQFESMMRIS